MLLLKPAYNRSNVDQSLHLYRVLTFNNNSITLNSSATDLTIFILTYLFEGSMTALHQCRHPKASPQ